MAEESPCTGTVAEGSESGKLAALVEVSETFAAADPTLAWLVRVSDCEADRVPTGTAPKSSAPAVQESTSPSAVSASETTWGVSPATLVVTVSRSAKALASRDAGNCAMPCGVTVSSVGASPGLRVPADGLMS